MRLTTPRRVSNKLSGNSYFWHLKALEINDPKGPDKNITTAKYEATYNGCHTAIDTCCGEICISEKSLGSIKITLLHENCRLCLIEYVHEG
jgi:hypothetical protein